MTTSAPTFATDHQTTAALRKRLEWVLDTTGWSARELARRAGLKSESHVSLIMRGQSARNETLESIASAAGVRSAWLILGEGEAIAPDAPPKWMALRAARERAPESRRDIEGEVLPLELERVTRRRRLSEATWAALDATPKRGQSEEAWELYVDALEAAARMFERMLEVDSDRRDVGIGSSPTADVIRSPAKGTSRQT